MTHAVQKAPHFHRMCSQQSSASPRHSAHPSSPASTRGMGHSSALRIQPKRTMLCTHLHCIPGTLPLKEIGKLNLNRREPNIVRECHVMHVYLCLPSDKDLSVCIHTPTYVVCACVHVHAHVDVTCMVLYYRHSTYQRSHSGY